MIIYFLTRFFCGAFAKIFFRLKVEGWENLPRKGGFILAVNHASSLDPFIIIAAIPRYIRWLVIYEYYDLWYLRWLLKQMRFIRVENSLPKQAFRTLLQGGIVGLFPEGRRTWSGKLGPGRPGAAALARRTSCPVVPVGISGSFTALPRTRKRFKLHPITVRIGAPLSLPEVTNKEEVGQADQENTQRIMARIGELLY
ncbi:MAG: 1-acyl-sn-glycerol-3-phosphate acyltransferase [Candidatus Omnitrophica bacterium]|nr:1-acyl-sn-glycerol-3-phosphate acyltransferase [Candidatus Omnitrophota bacterium]